VLPLAPGTRLAGEVTHTHPGLATDARSCSSRSPSPPATCIGSRWRKQPLRYGAADDTAVQNILGWLPSVCPADGHPCRARKSVKKRASPCLRGRAGVSCTCTGSVSAVPAIHMVSQSRTRGEVIRESASDRGQGRISLSLSLSLSLSQSYRHSRQT
jgi:hypothetical protein